MTLNSTTPACAPSARAPRPAVRAAGRTGFTLVELLVVIGIILILVSILLPVVGKVRTQAKVAATKNEMQNISVAIEQYYAEYKAYPGPVSNIDITKNQGPVSGMTMTENMVVALCGGLRNTNGTIAYWQSDLLTSIGPSTLNANPLKQGRHPEFINATPGQRMPDQPWDNGNGTGNGITGTNDTVIPEFMDRFPNSRPILYLRALKGNPPSVTTGTTVTLATPNDTTTQYNFSHLFPYVNTAAGDFAGFAGVNSTPRTDVTYYTMPASASGSATPATVWDAYFANPNFNTAPRGQDTFILISAGPDNVFGTTDDIIYPW